MSRSTLAFLLWVGASVAQSNEGYPDFESLAISGDGQRIVFLAQLALRGETSNLPLDRMYRYEPSGPVIQVYATATERFQGAFLAAGGEVVAQFCVKNDPPTPRPIAFPGLCLNWQGRRAFILEGQHVSRNGRFVWQRSSNGIVLRDLEAAQEYPMPFAQILHRHNGLSDDGTAVTLLRDTQAGDSLARSAIALTRPGEDQRVVYRGASISYAAITPDGKYVFVRDDQANSLHSLVEIELATNRQRTIFETNNDRFHFRLSHDGSRVLIRYYQALSVWDRASGAVKRIVDSPDFLRSAVMSDDGRTVVYQRNNGAIRRVRVDEANPTPGVEQFDAGEELYGPTPSLNVASRTVYPGSAVFFSGSGISADTEITLGQTRLPLLRLREASIVAQELLTQLPWDFEVPPIAAPLKAVRPGSPFEFRSTLSFLQEPTPNFFLIFDSTAVSFVAAAASEDFSTLIDSQHPALAGSLIHVYLGALGPLDRPVGNEEPGPSDPPAKPLAQIRCSLQNLETPSAPRDLEIPTLIYAPGLVGAYQADMRIPADWPSGRNRIECRTESQRGVESRLFTLAR